MTTAQSGPGTPEYFYSVGGVGDEVLHPETGEPLINPQSGAPVVQEHPKVEAEALVASAQAKVDKANDALESAKQELAEAKALLASADDRYDEIVAHLVSVSTTEG